MRIAIGSDHRGYKRKEVIKEFLKKQQHIVFDYGCNSVESVNYIDYALEVALAVRSGKCDRGILICNDGLGMSIVANKVPGIRCALCHNTYYAEISRIHNDANILAFGCVQDELEALDIVSVWLKTPFEGGRHTERMKKLSEFEERLISGRFNHE